MNPLRRYLIAWLIALTPLAAHAQISDLTMRLPRAQGKERWPLALSYRVHTDYADNSDPRGYVHGVSGSLSYLFSPYWRVNADLGLRAQTIGGQIPKEEEQSYSETVNPTTVLSLIHEGRPWSRHSYNLVAFGQPLWDEASRLEGYKGVVGAGGGLSFKFFGNRFAMNHSLELAEIINTYHFHSSQRPNPDYWYTYQWLNTLRVWKSLRLGYMFGAKITRYMDDQIGYSYLNTYSLSYSWDKFTTRLSYENGGYTNNGEVSLWFIDEHRRIARLTLGYTF